MCFSNWIILLLYSKLKDSVLCVDEHMQNCFTATQRKVFNHVVAGARQFLAELCVSGPIQEGRSIYFFPSVRVIIKPLSNELNVAVISFLFLVSSKKFSPFFFTQTRAHVLHMVTLQFIIIFSCITFINFFNVVLIF